MDGDQDGSSCSQTDSVFCDRCRMSSRAKGQIHKESREEPGIDVVEESDAIKGADIIQRRLRRVQASQELMMAVMDRLQGDCKYCGLMLATVEW